MKRIGLAGRVIVVLVDRDSVTLIPAANPATQCRNPTRIFMSKGEFGRRSPTSVLKDM
jgi:hypothetical protein